MRFDFGDEDRLTFPPGPRGYDAVDIWGSYVWKTDGKGRFWPTAMHLTDPPIIETTDAGTFQLPDGRRFRNLAVAVEVLERTLK